jgi:transposase
MTTRPTTPCPSCGKLRQENLELQARLRASEQQVKQLQTELAQARKNSSTSSKPPSSDIVKPPKPTLPAPDEKRSPGGQPGHAPHFRDAFPPEQVSDTILHRLSTCPECGGVVHETGAAPRVIQQIELVPLTTTVEEHQSYSSWCPHCRKAFAAPLPERIAHGGLLGTQLTALVAYLKGACHASFSTIRKFFRDVLQIKISRGYLVEVIRKVTAALETSYQELLRLLPDEEVVNVDETGHKLKRLRWWTWCFRAELYVLYHIDAHRSAEVLMTILGKEYAGVLGCDYLSTYRRYMRECNIVVQFCLAHLIRDVKFLTTLPDAQEKAYGERLREALRDLFGIIHERDQVSDKEFQRRLVAQREKLLEVGTQRVPAGKHAQVMARRLRKHGQAYFTFITTPGIEPTNNLAEQAIRFVVIDRHITQGTRSEGGNRWSERIWTVVATCALQGRSVLEFLQQSVSAYWEETEPPKLVPSI